MKQFKIGIVGAGNFGKGLAELISRYAAGYPVIILDKAPDSEHIENIESLRACDIIFPCVPISRFEMVIQQIAPIIKKDVTVVDICTIKEYSSQIMEKYLPADAQLIASHPLFGPESLEAVDWQLKGLNLVIWPQRISREIFEQVLAYLKSFELNVIVKSPCEHDSTLAKSQFLSLLIGALLVRMDIQSTDMNTRSFDELLDVKYTTCHDYSILLDVFKYNAHCEKTLGELKDTFKNLIQELQTASEKAALCTEMSDC